MNRSSRTTFGYVNYANIVKVFTETCHVLKHCLLTVISSLPTKS